jgi:hypothetical protein
MTKYLLLLSLLALAGCHVPDSKFDSQAAKDIGSVLKEAATVPPTTQPVQHLNADAVAIWPVWMKYQQDFGFLQKFYDKWNWTWLGVRGHDALWTLAGIAVLWVIGFIALDYFSAGFAGKAIPLIGTIAGHLMTGGTVFLGRAFVWIVSKFTDGIDWVLNKVHVTKPTVPPPAPAPTLAASLANPLQPAPTAITINAPTLAGGAS